MGSRKSDPYKSQLLKVFLLLAFALDIAEDMAEATY